MVEPRWRWRYDHGGGHGGADWRGADGAWAWSHFGILAVLALLAAARVRAHGCDWAVILGGGWRRQTATEKLRNCRRLGRPRSAVDVASATAAAVAVATVRRHASWVCRLLRGVPVAVCARQPCPTPTVSRTPKKACWASPAIELRRWPLEATVGRLGHPPPPPPRTSSAARGGNILSPI